MKYVWIVIDDVIDSVWSERANAEERAELIGAEVQKYQIDDDAKRF